MDCFGTYFTHAQTCNVTRVQSATEWTASVHTLHMPKHVEQTGETQTRWKTWPNWLPGPESPKKTEKKTRALEFNDGPQ